MQQLTIESTSVETLGVELRSEDDPTGGAVEFSAVVHTASDPSSWVAGTWDAGTPWSSTSYECRAVTPSIGAAGAAIVLAEGSLYKLYSRVGGQTVELAAMITVT